MGSLVYEGRRLTATEAEQHGLVDSVLWPSCFQEDLIPRVHKLATQSTQVLHINQSIGLVGIWIA